MNNYLKIFLVAIVAALIVVMVVDRGDDLGSQVEEAANDAGREIEDATD
ncbi:hypothetical protein [Kordiimonas pumila]|uniref:Entericidin n=1 Tax=Kordiimonas pumila TaxID=2161677 RepID=A0ABV7D3K8_9PROT|nr:hypothetical protein [Kordiimonas pumila]